MQNDMREYEVGESSLGADTVKLGFVLWIHLQKEQRILIIWTKFVCLANFYFTDVYFTRVILN